MKDRWHRERVGRRKRATAPEPREKQPKNSSMKSLFGFTAPCSGADK